MDQPTDAATPSILTGGFTSAIIENRLFDEIAVGDHASVARRVRLDDIELFAIISGDISQFHREPVVVGVDLPSPVTSPGGLTAALISTVLGTKLPGPGMTCLAQDLQFLAPVHPGDTITARVTVTSRDPTGHVLMLRCVVINQHGFDVMRGTAQVEAPTVRQRRAVLTPPDVRLMRHARFEAVMERVAGMPPVPTAIAHPCDVASLTAAVEATEAGLIVPILVGPAARILALAAECRLDIATFRMEDAPHSQAAASQAVALVRAGQAAQLMKGSLHTEELLHEVMRSETGLRTGRRLSHVYVLDVPGYARPLLITDGAINIAPTLEDKRCIVQNAIDLAHALGIAMPRVAILAAVETINPAMAATLDAAALCKMADRGQITGGLLDGPLALDNAISPEAAREKGIVSLVAGRADILVVPEIEAGNMLAKQMTFLGGADAAGIVLGARVPIILTSRADTTRTRLASCAIGAILVGTPEPLASP